jgi:hypothetical protein
MAAVVLRQWLRFANQLLEIGQWDLCGNNRLANVIVGRCLRETRTNSRKTPAIVLPQKTVAYQRVL